MSEPEKMRQQIKAELRRLEEKKKQLTDEKAELEAKIPVLKNLLNIIQDVTSPAELEKMVMTAKTKTVVRPNFFKTSRYLVEKDLQSKLEEDENRLSFVDQDIRKTDGEICDEKICPDCQGQGVKTSTEFVREDNIVRSVLKTEACPLCEGKGKID